MKTLSPVGTQLEERRRPSPGFKFTLTTASAQTYSVRLASSPADIRAAQALRFHVFNPELAEELDPSCETLFDVDEFDAICDHLVAEDSKTGHIVGTYRLQAASQAAACLGYYSAREFDLSPFECLPGRVVELGRGCVARAHQNLSVLQLLWRGVAFYARTHGSRYLLGCCFLHSQDPRAGAALYSRLMRQHLAPLELQTRPRAGLACPLDQMAEEAPPLPKLLEAYLALGAKICGPPAIHDRFKTIDFLTLLDLQSLSREVAERYLR